MQLATHYDAAMARWSEGPQDQSAHPKHRFEAEFLFLAKAGDPRASTWLFVNETSALKSDGALALRLIVSGARAPWVAEVLPLLPRFKEGLDLLAANELLERFDVPSNSKAVRSAALIARHGLLDKSVESKPLLYRAALLFAGQDSKRIDLSRKDAERLSVQLAGAHVENSSAWYRESYRPTGTGSFYASASTPPNPAAFTGPLQEALALRGSAYAHLWLLSNAHMLGGPEAIDLRTHLASLAAGPVDGATVEELAFQLDDLAQALGPEFVEKQVLTIISKLNEKQRAQLMLCLGEALCKSASQDVALRQRGLALFDRVVEAWPDSVDAKTALTKRFRYDRLAIGNIAPDVVAFDVEGREFKLSDYRGKITVIDFWGFW